MTHDATPFTSPSGINFRRPPAGLLAADRHRTCETFKKRGQSWVNTGWTRDTGCLTCLHALVVILRGGRSVVGFVDGCPEALVAAAAPDDAGARPVEGEVPVEGDLGDGGLEALQRAGLL